MILEQPDAVDGALIGRFAVIQRALFKDPEQRFASVGEMLSEVEVACGLLLVYALGAVIGPIVAAVCMRLVGAGGLFAYTAAVHACIIVFAVHRLRQRTVSPLHEHISFADAMRVIPARKGARR